MCGLFPCIPTLRVLFFNKKVLREWKFKLLREKYLIDRSRHNIIYTVTSFVVLLDLPVMINILYEMIKILNKKMLNAISLYWLLNVRSEENNIINGYSNEPWINARGFSYLMSCKFFFFISHVILDLIQRGRSNATHGVIMFSAFSCSMICS